MIYKPINKFKVSSRCFPSVNIWYVSFLNNKIFSLCRKKFCCWKKILQKVFLTFVTKITNRTLAEFAVIIVSLQTSILTELSITSRSGYHYHNNCPTLLIAQPCWFNYIKFQLSLLFQNLKMMEVGFIVKNIFTTTE